MPRSGEPPPRDKVVPTRGPATPHRLIHNEWRPQPSALRLALVVPAVLSLYRRTSRRPRGSRPHHQTHPALRGSREAVPRSERASDEPQGWRDARTFGLVGTG